MSFVPTALRRSRLYVFATSRKEYRYIISGSLSEILELVSFMLMLWVTGWLYISNSLSFILGVLTGFYLHKTFSFPGVQQFRTRYQLVGYLSLAAINFVLINLLVGSMVYRLHLHPHLAKLLAIGLVAIWSFGWSNFVFFRHKKT